MAAQGVLTSWRLHCQAVTPPRDVMSETSVVDVLRSTRGVLKGRTLSVWLGSISHICFWPHTWQ